jgi:hypothetical protein
MLKSVSAETLSDVEIKKLLQRPRIDFTSILSTVSELAAAATPGPAAGLLSQPLVVSRRLYHEASSTSMKFSELPYLSCERQQ